MQSREKIDTAIPQDMDCSMRHNKPLTIYMNGSIHISEILKQTGVEYPLKVPNLIIKGSITQKDIKFIRAKVSVILHCTNTLIYWFLLTSIINLKSI